MPALLALLSDAEYHPRREKDRDARERRERDERTKALLPAGEINGSMEEAAELAAGGPISKPMAARLAARPAQTVDLAGSIGVAFAVSG